MYKKSNKTSDKKDNGTTNSTPSAPGSIAGSMNNVRVSNPNTGNDPVTSRLADDEIDWMPDTSVSRCIICEKGFGRINNRKHHCRNCGRVICGNCSTKRIVLKPGDEPRRVCDDCHNALTMKQQVRIFKLLLAIKCFKKVRCIL